MKKLFSVIILVSLCLSVQARKQWTEKQAWQWYERVGVIKGFNQPYPAYPSQTLDEMLQKASSLGLNSVRFWIHGETAEQQIEHVRQMADTAAKYGMTVSPVISRSKPLYRRYLREDKAFPYAEYELEVRQLVRAFAKDSRVIFWDICNEPDYKDTPSTYAGMDLLEKMVEWLRDEDICQPITSSIIWDYPDADNKALKRICEVERMMDIHNIHTYECVSNLGRNVREQMDFIIRELGNRPMVATECLTRVDGSGIARSFAAFAPYKVGFYIWGLYMNDRNWESRWDRSTLDAYEPSFHNILYADGTPIDERELQLIRDYHFTDNFDEGVEITDRFTTERAWKWMSIGPVKGYTDANHIDESVSENDGYNAIRVCFNIDNWKQNREPFYKDLDAVLDKYDKRGTLVQPVLLTDYSTRGRSVEELQEYVLCVINRFYADPRILAWDLFWDQGIHETDLDRKMQLVTSLFRYGRQAYANQPLTMTPFVRVKEFPEGFNPWEEMLHGRTAGWTHLIYGDTSSDKIVYKTWSLSDVVSYYGGDNADHIAWLGAVCQKFGRPVFCMGWNSDSSDDIDKILDRFAHNHVFWFRSTVMPDAKMDKVRSFRFFPVSTQRQVMVKPMVNE